MATANDILAVARSQIGTTEYPPDSNNVRYNTAYYGRSVSGSVYPWCMVFIWWVFWQAGASKLFYDGERCAGCTTFMNWAKRTGRWVTSDYRPGDIVLYQFDYDDYADHCGIVEVVRYNGVDAIEGNTSMNGSQDNGGAVLRRYRSYDLVLGAYRPDYTGAAPTIGNFTESTEVFNLATLKMLARGDTGKTVKAMQLMLKGYGYSLGWYGADGVFGSATEKALIKYQKANGLDTDGICGPKTWASLLGA